MQKLKKRSENDRSSVIQEPAEIFDYDFSTPDKVVLIQPHDPMVDCYLLFGAGAVKRCHGGIKKTDIKWLREIQQLLRHGARRSTSLTRLERIDIRNSHGT